MERGAWRGVGRKGWQRVGERLAEKVGKGLVKGWRRVGGFPCTLQFRNSRGIRLENPICDSMANAIQMNFTKQSRSVAVMGN